MRRVVLRRERYICRRESKSSHAWSEGGTRNDERCECCSVPRLCEQKRRTQARRSFIGPPALSRFGHLLRLARAVCTKVPMQCGFVEPILQAFVTQFLREPNRAEFTQTAFSPAPGHVAPQRKSIQLEKCRGSQSSAPSSSATSTSDVSSSLAK